MKKNISKIILGLQLMAAILVIGAVYSWAPVCDGLLQLQNGNMVHMKCFYTAQASVALAIILFVAGIMAYLSKTDHRKVQWIVFILGVMLIANTVDSAIGIGICKKVMACHETAFWIKSAGIVAILSSLLDIAVNSSDPNK